MSGKKRLSLAVLLLALTAAGCGNGNVNKYTISGTITSSGSGLQGVTVTVNEASGGTAITDSNGNYTLQDLPDGNTYTITPTRTGYTFSPSALTAVVNGANVSGQDFTVTSNSALVCTAGNGSGTDGIQFTDYGGIVAQDSTFSANAAETSTLTWQATYQNIFNLSADAYSGSIRTRLWAVPYSVSSGVFDNAYVLGVFEPSFTGSGAASSNQLYVGATSDIQVTNSSMQNPPAGEYCVVATLEVYNTDGTKCSSSDHYCVSDWWQYGSSWRFY